MKITKRQLREGERIPFGYGLAFWDFALAMGVFYPIPINVFIRLVRLVYFAFMSGLIPICTMLKLVRLVYFAFMSGLIPICTMLKLLRLVSRFRDRHRN